MATDRRVARAAGMIALLTLVSRVLGFIRESLAGRLFSRLETDAYFAAFAVPDFMYYLLVGGALSAAFIPVFTEYLAKGEEREGWRAASTFINTVVALLIVLSGMGMIFSGPVGWLEAPGFRRPEVVRVRAASPTLAAVAAGGFGLPQARMELEIEAGRVEVDGQQVPDPMRILRPGATLSLRGRGRVVLLETASSPAAPFVLKRIGVKTSLVSILTRVMFSSVAMLAVAGLLSGVLYSYQSFLTPTLGPVVYNIGIIGGAVLLGGLFGIKGMAFGVVAGALASVGLQVWSVARRHPAYTPFTFAFRHPGFVRMLRLLLPAMLGLSATQLNILFTNMMASVLSEASISALRFANRLIQLPLGIFAAAIGTAFFPAMTRAVAEGEMDTYRETFSLGLRAIFFITIPAAVGLVVLRDPIVRLLFQGGRFTAADTRMTSYALAFYCPGIFAHGAILLLPRAFYSLQDTRTPVLVTITTVAVSLGLNLIFLRFTDLGHGGLALSATIMGLLNMAALLHLLHRKVGRIGGRAILRTFILSGLAGLAMGMALLAVKRFLPGLSFLPGRRPILAAGIEVAIGMGSGVILYGAIAYALKMEEMGLLVGLLKRCLKRRGETPEGAA